jgi:hypothetical protein
VAGHGLNGKGAPSEGANEGSGRCCDVLHGLDADDRHNAGGFELAPGVSEEGLHGSSIELAADLVRAGDSKALTSGGKQTTAFELFLQCLAFGFRAFEHGVSA